MSTVVDTTQTYDGSISGGVSADGSDITVEGVILTVIVPANEVPALLAGYSATDPTSPSEAVSRQIARAVLDALAAYTP